MAAKRKPYISTRRQERAADTRRRLADSARRLFREQGYTATTIAEIAQHADLAVQTFYAVFGSKRAVLMALVDRMEQAAELPQLLQQLAAASGAPEQLALIVEFNVRLFDRGADVLEIVRAAASADPDIAALKREGDARRRRDQGRLVRGWAQQGALLPGIPEREAADVLWALTSPDVYQLFVEQNGWTKRKFGGWLRAALTELLFSKAQ
jgi:AcrR family transcriptional regulator